MTAAESPLLEIPTIYQAGYQRARAVDSELADRYLAHTTISDPLADAMDADLAKLSRAESYLFIEAGMEQNEAGLRDAPDLVREFFETAAIAPPWLDMNALQGGVDMFHRNARVVLSAMVAGVLVEGFASTISKAFFISGRLRDHGVRRLKQNNRHLVEIFMPNGLERYGDGWKLSVRIRIIHARVRSLMLASDDWDTAAWGMPVSAAHLGLAISSFSARLLRHMESLGAKYSDEERASFMAVWRYCGYLMGIPESILFEDEAEANRIFDIAELCEPEPQLESVVLANGLINAAPLVAGITDPKERANVAALVYRVSRGLIGDELADQLHYPRGNSWASLRWLRFQNQYSRLVGKISASARKRRSLAEFETLLQASVYEDLGITYSLPDHVHSERSSHW